MKVEVEGQEVGIEDHSKQREQNMQRPKDGKNTMLLLLWKKTKMFRRPKCSKRKSISSFQDKTQKVSVR